MKEFTIALTILAPNETVAKNIATEAQHLVDIYGTDTFLRAVEFIKRHPDMVNIALGMINRQ